MRVAYRKGLHEVGDGLFAYLQPDGTWGWSNAGLVTGPGTSLLVDTLFDLRLTREMLDAMRPVTDRHPIGAAMNTHGNGDHCFGNALLPDGAEVYATAAATPRCGPRRRRSSTGSNAPRASAPSSAPTSAGS